MENENSFGAECLQILKGAVLSALFCLILSLVFALVLRFTELSDSVIKPINQFIKAFSVLLGCLAAVRGSKGWMKGLFVGLLSIMLTCLVFSLIGGGAALRWLIFVELLFGALVGALGGIVAVNVKRDR
ncbi:MAG: TIGR04086 family membrane protein [Clostridia bacterium]|nr:TIGR04086 family membrane protein [Clostridia bacterium]